MGRQGKRIYRGNGQFGFGIADLGLIESKIRNPKSKIFRVSYILPTLCCLCASFFSAGCQTVRPPEPIPSTAFYQQTPTSPAADPPEPHARSSSQPTTKTALAAHPATAPIHDLPLPSTTVTGPPASAPAAVPGDTLGTYLTLGAVLAEVNGNGIYADEVFARVDKALHAKAMELDQQGYTVAAQQLIHDEVMTRISDELAYSAAKRSLSPQDQTLADAATERWRQKQITEAGGSLQLARAKARSEGDDFDKMVQRQQRRLMIELYRQKKIYPRVQVTVQDMRQYYNRHRDTLYTEHPAARFLVIKVDPDRSGGREAALKKIQEIRRRVLAGEDFGKLAHDMSDDSALRQKDGDVGWVDKGAYRLDAVEKAACALQPGEVSDIIDTDGSFYLVKLLALKRGQVIPFENEQVQEQINQTLRLQQVRQLVSDAEEELRANAAVWNNPRTESIVMEMAMQRYAQWHEQR
jgi:parvulin-like peptidyl-prolyl isomerase